LPVLLTAAEPVAFYNAGTSGEERKMRRRDFLESTGWAAGNLAVAGHFTTAASAAPPLHRTEPLHRVEELHALELDMFETALHPLRRLLEEHRVERILFSGAITMQSGRAVAMMAPVLSDATMDVEVFLESGGLFGVLWVAGEVIDTRFKPLAPGVYALSFVPPVETALVEFITPHGKTSRRLPAVITLAEGDDGLLERIKEALRGLRFLLNVEVVLGEPTDVRGSALFFSFHLFDDP
jgi:hypothetical protein